MKRFREHPVFGAALVTILVAIVALSVVTIRLAVSNHRARATLKRAHHDVRTFAAAGPLLSDAESTALATEISRIGQATAALESELNLEESAVAPAAISAESATSTEAYFQLAAFADRMRTCARRNGVGVTPDERYGFAAYAKTGPEPELVPAVFRQRAMAEEILETLFEARPRRFLGLARERYVPGKTGRVTAVSTSIRDGGTADYFELVSERSIRVGGEITSLALRVSFIADTAVLRNWLGEILRRDSRLMVRGVEAEAVTDADDGRPLVSGLEKAVSLAVTRLTKFTVVLEAVEILPTQPSLAQR